MESLLPENQDFWRTDAHPLQLFLEQRHSYPSRDELLRVHLSAFIHSERGHCIDDASRLCSLHHCMHRSLSVIIWVNLNKFKFSMLLMVFRCLRPEKKRARDQIGIYHLYSPCTNVSDFIKHCAKCVQLVHSSTRGHGWPMLLANQE